jgi:hypothetical protein
MEGLDKKMKNFSTVSAPVQIGTTCLLGINQTSKSCSVKKNYNPEGKGRVTRPQVRWIDVLSNDMRMVDV